MSFRSHFFSLIDLLEKLAIIATGVFAVFGVITFYLSVEDTKKARTMVYFDNYRAGVVLEARRQLDQIMMNALRANIPADHVEEFIIANVTRNKRHHTESVVNFYDSLKECVETDICHRDLALCLFDDEAASDFGFLMPAIARLRQSDADYAIALESFSRDGRCSAD